MLRMVENQDEQLVINWLGSGCLWLIWLLLARCCGVIVLKLGYQNKRLHRMFCPRNSLLTAGYFSAMGAQERTEPLCSVLYPG